MNKKTIMLFSAIFIALIAFSVTYFVLSPKSTTDSSEEDDFNTEQESSAVITESAEADEVISSFATIGNELILHSRQYSQGEQQEENSVFLGFDGDMVLSVKEINVLDFSANDDEIRDSWKSYSDQFENPCIIEFKISLKNNNASKLTGQSYLFDSSIFKLGAWEDLVPENISNAEGYFTVSERYSSCDANFFPHTEKSSTAFELNKGETKDFVIRFLANRSYLSLKQPFLAISSGNDYHYGVLLPDTVIDS